MVRFYKSYLDRLLLGLLILIELEKQGGKQAVIAAVDKWQPADPNQALVIRNSLDIYAGEYPDESPSNEDVLNGAFGQLLKRKNDDGDLLDVIVNALRLPFASYLNTQTIKVLRDAILTPSELAQLKADFKSASKCACGHEFKTGEITSVSIQDNLIVVSCTACAKPVYVRCDYCHELLEATSKVTGSLRTGVDCGCRKRQANEAEAAATGLTPAQLRILKRQQERLAVKQARFVSRTPPAGTTIPANWVISSPNPFGDV